MSSHFTSALKEAFVQKFVEFVNQVDTYGKSGSGILSYFPQLNYLSLVYTP